MSNHYNLKELYEVSLEHKQLIINADISIPPTDVKYIKTWVKKLIKDIDMEILMGPYAVYSDMPGNRGLTVSAIINTSHICLHTWDEDQPHLRLDVYSCKDFDINIVFDAIKEFDIKKIQYHYLDRNDKIIHLNSRFRKINDYINSIFRSK